MKQDNYNKRCDKLMDLIISTFKYDSNLIYLYEEEFYQYVIDIDRNAKIHFLVNDWGNLVMNLICNIDNSIVTYRPERSEKHNNVLNILKLLDKRMEKHDSFTSVENKIDYILRSRKLDKIIYNDK